MRQEGDLSDPHPKSSPGGDHEDSPPEGSQPASFDEGETRLQPPGDAAGDTLAVELDDNLRELLEGGDGSSGAGSGSGSDLRSSLASGRRARRRRRGADDPLRGFVLDQKYELLEALGHGGMATVYRARHLLLEKELAIKFIRPESADSERFKRRFFREARLTSELVHRNIAQVREFGASSDGVLYMVSDFCPGQTLGELLEQTGPLPVRRACAIGKQVLSAMAEAHRRGISHRDLKPENVIVGEDDHVWVLDFGLAKGTLDADESHLTRAGAVVGTPRYMSPEQAAGRRTDSRTDLYSFGVVLYQVLAGQYPFPGDTAEEVLRAHLTSEPIPFSERVPGLKIPAELQDIVMRALAKAPSERWQTAEELEQALDAFLAGDFTEMDVPLSADAFEVQAPLRLGELEGSLEAFRVRRQGDDHEGLLWVLTLESLRRDTLAAFLEQIEIVERIEHRGLETGYEGGVYDRARNAVYAHSPWRGARSLSERISEGPLAESEWIPIARGLLEGLARAHEFSTPHQAVHSLLVGLTETGPVLHGLGLVAAQGGWGNPVNDVEDMALLMLQMAAGAHGDEVGRDLVREHGLKRVPAELRPILQRALEQGFPSAGALLRALQLVDPRFLDTPSAAHLPVTERLEVKGISRRLVFLVVGGLLAVIALLLLLIVLLLTRG